MNPVEALATVLSAVGMFFNARGQLRRSYYLWIGGNAMWVFIGFTNHMYGMSALFAYYLAMSIVGIIKVERT